MTISDSAPSPTRRKVRKGTHSCWECKRRKIRCILAQDDNICKGCRQRKATCVAQDLPEDLSPAVPGNRHLGHRIARVEGFMKEYLTGHAPEPPHREAHVPEETFDGTPLSTSPEAESTRQALLAAFPCDADVDLLSTIGAVPTLYNNLLNFHPHGSITLSALSIVPAPTPLPSPDIHPVLLAKRMLEYALILQIPRKEMFTALSEPSPTLMRRLVSAASMWVTARAALHDSLEGILCIILEGVYEINGGNLRRAWVVFRRALTVAQLMGLHKSAPVKRLQKSDVDPGFIWFRIVYMDRYLSILLGMPQGTSDKSTYDDGSPLGKFEGLLSSITSQILERNSGRESQDIDAQLLQAANTMPSTFWRPADFTGLLLASPASMLETSRLGTHVYYYSLIIQLHLPYMMKGDNGYAKMACVNASREIMTRFTTHRIFNPVSSCSRPVDFFALLAGMTLVLAHLDGHREAGNVLAHQRVSDRALLDQALERMRILNDGQRDVITKSTAELIQQLLDVEADAACGNEYTATVNDKGEEGLRLHIPYLGIVRIAQHAPISQEVTAVGSSSTTGQAAGYEKSMLRFPQFEDDELPSAAAGVCEWALQGVDMAFFDNLLKGAGEETILDGWLD